MLSTHTSPADVNLEEAGGCLLGRGSGAKSVGSRTGNARPGLRWCWQAGAVVLSILVASLLAAKCHGGSVFGNYAGYRFWQMSPDQNDWSGINCVIHFAALPQADGTIDLNRFQLFPARIEQMVRLARENEACVLLTVGGANTKRGFEQATVDAAVRAKLIDNIVNAVVEHGYDGVDIDWEPLQDSDEAQFVSFVRELRARLDAAVPGAMLTAAAAGLSDARAGTQVLAGRGRQASDKRQGTKSRGWGSLDAGGPMGIRGQWGGRWCRVATA